MPNIIVSVDGQELPGHTFAWWIERVTPGSDLRSYAREDGTFTQDVDPNNARLERKIFDGKEEAYDFAKARGWECK